MSEYNENMEKQMTWEEMEQMGWNETETARTFTQQITQEIEDINSIAQLREENYRLENELNRLKTELLEEKERLSRILKDYKTSLEENEKLFKQNQLFKIVIKEVL